MRTGLAALGLALFMLVPAGAASGQLNAMPPVAAPDEQLVDATDPEAIAQLMRSAGYTAELRTQPTGAKEIESEAAGVNFWLYFQACNPDFTGCEVITFSAGFDFDTPQRPDILGDWNRTRYSKAYLDEDGDPFVEFSVNMVHGVSPENLLNTLNWFTLEMTAFMQQIGWHAEDAQQAQPI